MKKKLYRAVLLIVAFIILIPYTALALNPTITDNAGYLTEQDISELSSRLERLRSQYNMDVAVYIEENQSGSGAQASADDIFDYGGYGTGEGKDGIMLYLSRNPRQYAYTTHGDGERVFNDSGLEYIDNQVLPYLRDDDYYSAVYAYTEAAEELLVYASEGHPYDGSGEKNSLIAIAAVILAPFIIAFIMTSSKSKQMKTAVSNDYADSYLKPGSMNLTMSNDIFLYSVVNRTEKPKSESGGHVSSSGEHHGGRSGSY